MAKCYICGAPTWESKDGHEFCEPCWEDYRRIMASVDWQADPKFIAVFMRRKLERDLKTEAGMAG